jgi:hypothetical protein
MSDDRISASTPQTTPSAYIGPRSPSSFTGNSSLALESAQNEVTPPGSANDASPTNIGSSTIVERNILRRGTQDISWEHLNLFDLATSSDIKQLIGQDQEYQTLKNTWPRLVKLAETLIPKDFALQKENFWNQENFWNRDRVEHFIDVLQCIAVEYGPSPLELMNPETRSHLVLLVKSMPDNGEINQSSKARAAACLYRAKYCLRPDDCELLSQIMEDINLDEHMAVAVSREISHYCAHPEPNRDSQPSYDIRELVFADLTRPRVGQFKKLLPIVQNINNRKAKALALRSLNHAMPSFNQAERNELFTSTMQLLYAHYAGPDPDEIERSRTIGLIKAMLAEIEHLNPTQQETLIDFILVYIGDITQFNASIWARIELLYLLVKTLPHLNEHLSSKVITTLVDIEQRDKTDLVIHNVLSVLKIEELSSDERILLIKNILEITKPNRRSPMLDLLYSRMDWNTKLNYPHVLDAILNIDDDIAQVTPLHAAAHDIVWLGEKDRGSLISAVEKSNIWFLAPRQLVLS